MLDTKIGLTTWADADQNYSVQSGWKIARTRTMVSIIPARIPRSVQIGGSVGPATLGVALGVLVQHANHSGAALWFFSLAGVVLGMLNWTVMAIVNGSRMRGPPFFIFQFADGIILLPRHRQRLTADRLREFQLLTNNQSPHRMQINLVVGGDAEGAKRFGLVGTQNSKFITSAVEELSEATGIRVRRQKLGDEWSKNLCAQCGYDLRATLDRCPECGAMPAGVKA